jgi:GAF domain-containing protein
MPSDKTKLTLKGFIESILQPNSNIKDSSSRQQARLTTLTSLILTAVCLVTGIIGLIVGFPPSLGVGFFILTLAMLFACWIGRTENFLVGSIILVSGMILGGFLISSAFHDNAAVVIILMATIVPALTFSIFLLPLLAIIIIAVVVLITIGVLPLMASISPSTELLIFIGLIVIQGIFILISRFRDTSETIQQDELGSLRGRLEERIEERTRYSRIAAEIAQGLATAKSTEDLFQEAVSMIAARMGFSFSAFYLPDEASKTILLKAAHGLDSDRMLKNGKRINYGPPSILGWVAENKQQRLITRLTEDPLLLEAEILPGNQSELVIPILSENKFLGILDLQSSRSTIFDNETIVVLQMLADQIATTIQNLKVFEVGQGSIQEVIEVYLTGYKILQSKSVDEIDQLIRDLVPKIPYLAIYLTPEGEELRAVAKAGTQLPDGQHWPDLIPVSSKELSSILGSDLFIGEGVRLNSLPYNLVRLIQQSQLFSVALIPVSNGDVFSGFFMLGTREKEPLRTSGLQPYKNLTDQIATTLNRIHETKIIDQRLADLGVINFQLQNVTELAEEITNAKNTEEVFGSAQRMFQHTSMAAILLLAEDENIRIAASMDPSLNREVSGLPEWLDISPADLSMRLGKEPLIVEVSKLSSLAFAQFHPELNKVIEDEASKLPVLNPSLLRILEQAHFLNVALIPVMRNEQLATLMIIGTRDDQPILPETVQACTKVAGLVTSSIERISLSREKENRFTEMETISKIGQEISTIRELNALYTTLHSYIRSLLGNVNFLVAIFNSATSSISIPYMYESGLEGGDVTSIDTFPLGEGLTSILIRTMQPLMLVEDTEKRAVALGAKIVGLPAKSWLGVPMIVSGNAVGALIVQDPEHEFAFNEKDMRMLSTLSTQVAGAVYNARLLEQMRSSALQLQTAAEVARDISGSLDLGELLNKAVSLIYERFNFYHAAIFLLDSTNEYAVIREATGEAGTQMKRAGHKLKVGSKSIVGYVTGSGEPLIVNDTSRDATYYANPLLPETHSEATIPLRIGQRILGALDVQSTRSYSFAEEDVSVLRILADQMAIAVINSELFADTQEHLSQHRLLHHVTTAAASGTTLEESLNSATQGLQVTLGGDRVSILLADKGKKTLFVRAFAGYSDEIGKLEIPFGEGITGWVAVHQQPQRINDVTQDPRYVQVGSNIRSELAIPLSYRGDLLGVLNVESDRVSAYNENDEELLGTLGGSLAAIISNARLIEQVRRQVDHERLLYEVTSKIRRSTDMQTIMATTAGELSKALGARRAQIKMGTVEMDPEPGKVIDSDSVSTTGDSA